MSSIATRPRPRSSPRRRHRLPSAHGSQTRSQRRLDRKQRRRRTRQARAARRQLQRIHEQVPKPAHSLFDASVLNKLERQAADLFFDHLKLEIIAATLSGSASLDPSGLAGAVSGDLAQQVLACLTCSGWEEAGVEREWSASWSRIPPYRNTTPPIKRGGGRGWAKAGGAGGRLRSNY